MQDAGWLPEWRVWGFSMSYRTLVIWQRGREVSVTIHKMTLTKLPKFEKYEAGSQIRQASQSIRANIVEGYGRRRYKQEFIKHLVYAHSSCDETADHLQALFETGSLKDEELYQELAGALDSLGRKIHRFIESVEVGHRS